MSGAPRRLQRRAVVKTETAGKNYRLTLDCGHTRLQSPAVAIPKYAYCGECPPVKPAQ